jgi:hypothetical protein
MSKGSKPRPIEIPMKEFDNNWDNIFRKNKDESSRSNSDNRIRDTKTMREECTESNVQ